MKYRISFYQPFYHLEKLTNFLWFTIWVTQEYSVDFNYLEQKYRKLTDDSSK
jgi:hypothetical protein